jgi:putative PIN family toxin of toxin-antitoxin system
VRALLDVNVFIAGLLSRTGSPALLLGKWLEGEFELVISDRLLDELEHTLARPKIRRLLDDDDVGAFLGLLRSGLADWVEDPEEPPNIKSRDPKDNYLIAAARSAQATLVTGDADLLALSDSIPVISPRAFLESLE